MPGHGCSDEELEERQKRRRTRTQRDSLDPALTDLTGLPRCRLQLRRQRPGQRGRVDSSETIVRDDPGVKPAPDRGGARLPRGP